MRDIKFRAWTTNSWINRGMVYDWQDTIYIESVCFVPHDEDIPIMQYTGLHDKNGKDIYEGDILQNVTEEQYAVKWNTRRVQFEATSSQGGYIPENIWFKSTVIGNIYENPEMIGGNNA